MNLSNGANILTLKPIACYSLIISCGKIACFGADTLAQLVSLLKAMKEHLGLYYKTFLDRN
jgi:hypothetical protein